MYTIAQLHTALTWAKAHPDATIRIGWAPYGQQTFTGRAWRQWFQQCLMTKINRTLPQPTWRKRDPAWWWEMRRAANQLNSRPRLVIRWLPKDLHRRFAERITTD